MRLGKIDYIVLIGCLLISRFPLLQASGDLRLITVGISLFPFWLIIFNNLGVSLVLRDRISFTPINRRSFRLFVLFLILLLISLLRGFIAGSLDVGFLVRHAVWWVTVVLFGIAVFLIPHPETHIRSLRLGVLYAAGIYVGTNVLLYIIGISSTREVLGWSRLNLGDAIILRTIGIDAERTIFPLASGITNFGAVGGLCTVIGLQLLSAKQKMKGKRIIGLFMLVTGVYVILRTDSRAALVWSLVVPIIIWTLARKLRRFLSWLPIAALTVPIFVVFVAPFISSSQIAGDFARSQGTENIASLSGRTIVWSNAVSELKHPSFLHLVGFGARGQVASGLGTVNMEIFDGYAEDSEGKSAHNFALQYVLDVGYFGLYIFILLVANILKTISKIFDYFDRCLYATVFAFLFFMGVTDVTPTIYVNETFTIMLLLIISFLRADESLESSRSNIHVRVA